MRSSPTTLDDFKEFVENDLHHATGLPIVVIRLIEYGVETKQLENLRLCRISRIDKNLVIEFDHASRR